jgi:glyoxylase-like metal-dependent hydrolase (beta-lactamase superfamily II)
MNQPAHVSRFPVEIFRLDVDRSTPADAPRSPFLARFHACLPDRPGSIAGLAGDIAGVGGNISLFHYDRAADAHRVSVEVHLPSAEAVDSLLRVLGEGKGLSPLPPSESGDEVAVTDLDGILEIKVRLVNEPGWLAAFAAVVARLGSNLTYMIYDEGADPFSAVMALVAPGTAGIDRLLEALNERHYSYRVTYRGGQGDEADRVIGLKLVERYFIRLRALLPESDVDEIRGLVESSRDLHQDLIGFYREAGNDLPAADVFETVLSFAARARGNTGDKFVLREMEPIDLGGAELLGFRLPTSENVYLVRHGDELTMIDAGHGIYFADLTRCWERMGLDPSRIRRILATHPDTDHIGAAGYFEEAYGTEVWMHPAGDEIISQMNRGLGAPEKIRKLNRYYTRLSVAFTACRFPGHPRHFETGDLGCAGAFRIADVVLAGPLRFEVLESRGGHVRGQVFLLERKAGLLFTSDYLLNTGSLSPDERSQLGIYRSMVINPNDDPALYRDECADLLSLATDVARGLPPAQGRRISILPGHGDRYTLD